MDIIISAEQGRGKTTLALAIAKTYLHAKHFSEIVQRVLQMNFVGDNVSYLTQKLREGHPEAIIFDGCINSAEEMLIAVEAVKRYREQTGHPRILAVYIEQQLGVRVILTDKPRKRCADASMNTLKDYVIPADFDPFTVELYETNLRRTHKVIDHIFGKVVDRATPEQAQLILLKLRELTGIDDDTSIQITDFGHHTARQLLVFLLDILKQQNEN